MTFDPNQPFTLTGQPEPREPERTQFLENATFPYQDLGCIAAETINALLSALRYARSLPAEADSPEEHALRH